MVNVNAIFQSKYLKASDLEGKPQLATINAVQIENMDDGKRKLCLSFNEFERGLLLNKTNTNNIAAFCGPETESWVGRQIVMQTALVDFQGKTVEAIRVRAPKVQVQAKPATDWQAPAANTQAAPHKGHPIFDDEVPFEFQWK